MRSIVLLLSAALLFAQADDPAAKAQRARDLVVAGKSEEAIPLYQELARAFPKDAGMLVNLCVAEFKARRYKDAAGHAEAAVKLDPGSLPANLFLGASYVELGQHALAVAPLETVIAAQPGDRNARVMLGEAMLALESYVAALTHFDKACELAPENPKGWYGLGRTFEALSSRASRQLEIFAPQSPYWHALAAGAYFSQRRYGSAFEHYRLAVAELPALPGLHAGLAAVYNQTGHPDWARTEEERERLAPPPDCAAPSLACHFKAGRYRDIANPVSASANPDALYWSAKAYSALAREAYDHLAQLPPSIESHLHAAKAFDAEGLDRKAAAEWREALQLSPGDATIQSALVWSLFRARDHEAALPLLQQLLDNQRDSRDLNFLYGASLMNLGQPAKAIPYLETAVRLDAQFLPTQAALGQALLRVGEPAQAIRPLTAALPADQDASVHFQLLRAYQLTGQTELARQAMSAYQQSRQSTEDQKRLEEGVEITRTP